MDEHTGQSRTNPSPASAPRRLGRGLGSLIPTVQAQPSGSSSVPVAEATVPTPAVGIPRASPPAGGVQELAIDLISPNPHQPRDTFNGPAIAELAESIRSSGLLQPVIVRPTHAADGSARFELIAGERRWRAVKSLGRKTIPAIVRDASERESAQLALVENMQRDDLNAAEKAFGLRALADEFGLNHQQVADAVGLDRSSVSNLIRLTELDGRALDLVRLGRLSAGHARALLGIKDVATRGLLADTAIMEEWSVRTLEREVQRSADRAASKSVSRGTSVPPTRSAHLSSLEDKLTKALGTRVHLQLGRTKGSGRMTIEFFSFEQFDGLIARLGVPDSISR